MIIINTSSYYKEIGGCLLKANIELLICSRGMLACWRRCAHDTRHCGISAFYVHILINECPMGGTSYQS